MSSRAALSDDGFDALDVEQLLQSYASATRVVASEQLVSRIQVRLAQEPPPTPWRRAWRWLHSVARAAFGSEQVATVVRLQALALLLLCALALGVAIGGAGAILVSLFQPPGETVDWPIRRSDVLPSPTGTSESWPTATSRSGFSTTPGPVDTSRAGRRPGEGNRRQPARETARRRHSVGAGSAAAGSAGMPTPTPTPTLTWAPSPTPSPQPTQAAPPSPGETATPTMSASPAPSVVPTLMPTATAGPDGTPASSASPDQTPSPTDAAVVSPPPTPTRLPAESSAPTPDPTIVPVIGPTAGPSLPPS